MYLAFSCYYYKKERARLYFIDCALLHYLYLKPMTDFKDLELTDNDIVTDDGDFNETTIDSINRYAMSEYKYTWQFLVYTKSANEYSHSSVTSFAKKLEQFFDIYNISHSDIYLTIVPDGRYDMSSQAVITQCDNYINIDSNIVPDNPPTDKYNYLTVFTDIPKFYSIRRMLNFMQSLMNIMYNSKHSITRHLNMFPEIKQLLKPFVHLPKQISINNYNKSFIQQALQELENGITTDDPRANNIHSLLNLIEWFFGPKTREKFVNLWDKHILDEYAPVPNDEPSYKIHIM